VRLPNFDTGTSKPDKGRQYCMVVIDMTRIDGKTIKIKTGKYET